MADSVISCEHLTHFYGKRKIYEDLNFEVAPGRIVGLLGKNGTGKTTTINILMGYLVDADSRLHMLVPDGRSLPGLRFTSSLDNWVKPRFK